MKLIDFAPIGGAIVLAIVCYLLAGIMPDKASTGLLMLAGGLAGWSLPQLSTLGRRGRHKKREPARFRGGARSEPR